MSDTTIAQFVARNVIDATTSTDRLALAFQALVKDSEDRERLLAVAQKDVAESPLGSTDGFEGVWDQLRRNCSRPTATSRSCPRHTAGSYRGARAGDHVEQTGDDPPERIGAWLSTVATTSLRALDLALVLDILRVETDDEPVGRNDDAGRRL